MAGRQAGSQAFPLDPVAPSIAKEGMTVCILFAYIVTLFPPHRYVSYIPADTGAAESFSAAQMSAYISAMRCDGCCRKCK